MRQYSVSNVVLGRHRAVVTCAIETGGKQYDNVRLFVRAEPTGQDWKLLGRANEAWEDTVNVRRMEAERMRREGARRMESESALAAVARAVAAGD